MPAADAAQYELAFHVLPTVAEGEVTDVVSALRSTIEAAGGTITEEEAPKRFDLAYEIIKYLEGRNRKFTSAYFGWIRFEIEPSKLAEVTEKVEETSQLLRHLLIRLTKAEQEHTFMFHEALEDDETEDSEVAEAVPAKEEKAAEATKEESTKDSTEEETKVK